MGGICREVGHFEDIVGGLSGALQAQVEGRDAELLERPKGKNPEGEHFRDLLRRNNLP